MIDLPQASTMDIPELLKAVDTDEKGLWESEAHKRMLHYGPNTLVEKKKTPVIIEFLNNFTNPLIIVLLVIAGVSFVMGSTLDSIIIAIMILMSVTLNFIQEYKASRATEALLSQVAHNAVVFRHGRAVEIPATKLVPGDIMELNAGDLVAADGRIIEAKDFFVNQSSLTGESFPVEKMSHTQSKAPDDISSMYNIVFSGTAVNTGWAKVIVVATGKQSEFGKLTSSMREIVDQDQFTKNLHDFSRMIIKLIVLLVVFIFGFKSLVHHDIWNSLQFAVAVAVGLTPEFLPMIMSVTMGKGSVKMAHKGVIVKRLTAIPTFGSMDVLCTDKTGTLTENKIAVVKYVDIYNQVSEEALMLAYLNSSFQSGINNPMDDAVKQYRHLSTKNYEKIDEIPFDFCRRRLTVVVKTKNEKGIMITKGAPESILEVVSIKPDVKKKCVELYHQFSKEGFRVLAIAQKEIDPNKHPYKTVDETGLSLVGLIAFLDPPKKGVTKALDQLESLGIDLKVISGDNELVTERICRDVDINIKGILLGNEIDGLSDAELANKAQEATVFARFSPEQKNRVIKALQINHHVVGYMGDGINDAPSLMTADVGISVANAVDVAREAADFVLTKKSLLQLTEGVKEGRKTFGNTMKYIMMGLSSNFGNMFSMIGAVVFLPFLPMLPMQILLNNFLYDLSQITIPTDNVDEEYIQTPKRMNLAQIKTFMWLFGPISSLFDFVTFGVLYKLFAHNAAAFQTGWFIESLATQTLVIYFIRTKKLPFIESKPSLLLGMTTIAVVITGWILATSSWGKIFGFTPLSNLVIITLIMVVVLYLLVVEMAKRFYQHLLIKQAYVA